jgi:NAD(P)-dependent dehydrogenase (short-subunit alcohol dehydrogenase family)
MGEAGSFLVDHKRSTMKITLEGKTALVTGGGAGIGRAILDAFSELGAQLAVAEINPEKCATLSAAFPDALIVQCDVQNKDNVEEVRKQIAERFGKLDILVNNVGHHLGVFKPVTELTDEDWDAQQSINLRQMFLVTRAMVPLMRKTGLGGSIINISSIEGYRGCPYNVAYTTAKHAITGFTSSLAVELGADQIRVNVIAPETTESEQVPLSMVLKPEYKEAANRTLVLGRFGRPSDHAGAAVYLATELSSWVTGTTIHVDGGSLAQGIFQRTPDGSWTVMPLVTDKCSY